MAVNLIEQQYPKNMGLKQIQSLVGMDLFNLAKRFRKEVADSRVLSTYRKKRWYVSKSEEKRKAKQRATGQLVAIKTMRLDQIDEPEKLQEVKTRFFREAESAGRLSHPNIVTIYDAGEEKELGYIAMELVEGKSLKEWSRKPNLMPLADLVQILASVADALDYAHQQGVVHRDIKPANIMITKDRLVKVMDFGIAKMASTSKTQTDVVLGTPTYMSPEQIAGKKVDGRSDVFSLGVVLFELLTGQPPFTADNLSALLFAIAHNPHPELQTLRQDLPPMFQEVLNRALQKDLPQRYRRAGEFAQDLRACLHSLAA